MDMSGSSVDWGGILNAGLGELTVLVGVATLYMIVWQVWLAPRRKKQEEERARLLEEKEKAKEEQHKAEIAELRKHFELDTTIASLKETADQHHKDILALAKDVNTMRQDVVKQQRELAEVHATVVSIDGKLEDMSSKMDAHIEQTAKDRQEFGERFARVEALSEAGKA